MAQVFPRSANRLVTASYIAGTVALVVGIVVWWFVTRSDFVRYVGEPIQQPIPFPHTIHVNELKLNCQYCHNGVGESAYSNVPATETCMSCHSQILTSDPKIQPLRDSWANNSSIVWDKVHVFPQYVYFNHSIHVNKGVGCSTCHGDVSQMAVVYKAQPMYMSWCLNCHRNPEQYLRPLDQIYNTQYQPPANQLELGQKLLVQY